MKPREYEVKLTLRTTIDASPEFIEDRVLWLGGKVEELINESLPPVFRVVDEAWLDLGQAENLPEDR